MRPMMWDTESRRMIPACCDACAHSHPSSVASSPCASSRMGAAVLGPDGKQVTTTVQPRGLPGLAVPVLIASTTYGAVLGGIAGAVAQDRGKRLKGTAWGAATGATLGAISGGLIAFVWRGGT